MSSILVLKETALGHDVARASQTPVLPFFLRATKDLDMITKIKYSKLVCFVEGNLSQPKLFL